MRYEGIVQEGKRRGRALGYPTINIPLADPSLSGVYAARVTIAGEAPYPAAVFADPSRGVLEAYLLDFSDELYGTAVTIELHKKLRESKTFSDDETLRAAIAEDVQAVREYFDL
jgi:riboflavin kinase/FMN adenylyltransferase